MNVYVFVNGDMRARACFYVSFFAYICICVARTQLNNATVRGTKLNYTLHKIVKRNV